MRAHPLAVPARSAVLVVVALMAACGGGSVGSGGDTGNGDGGRLQARFLDRFAMYV